MKMNAAPRDLMMAAEPRMMTMDAAPRDIMMAEKPKKSGGLFGSSSSSSKKMKRAAPVKEDEGPGFFSKIKSFFSSDSSKDLAKAAPQKQNLA